MNLLPVLLKKYWLQLSVTLLIAALAWATEHYRDNAIQYKSQRDTASRSLTLANGTITDMQTRQREVAALDARYTKELADAKAENDALRGDVAAGRRRLLVNAICSNSGAVAALAGTITTINTPTRGWTSVTNPAAAAVGAPAETDAELRIRQGQSVAIPSMTPFEGVDGAIANIAGVTRHKLYENDTGKTDGNGLPPHSISAIVDGGDVTEIARTIRGNKGQGVRTWGKTSVTVPDKYGNPHIISFSRPTDVPVYGKITLKVFAGYTSQIGVQIQQAVADYINRLMIGDQVLLSRIYSPANLGVVSGGNARYYDIQELLIGKSPEAVAAANINIAYDESASCKPENIIITVAA